jgi:hypothetical protein
MNSKEMQIAVKIAVCAVLLPLKPGRSNAFTMPLSQFVEPEFRTRDLIGAYARRVTVENLVETVEESWTRFHPTERSGELVHPNSFVRRELSLSSKNMNAHEDAVQKERPA